VTSAEAAHRRSGALARGLRSFRRWRRGRPFWAGFFIILGALQIFASTQLSLSGFQLKIGMEGFLSYVIPLVLVLCGLLTWLTPQHRVFYGVIAAAVALYSFIGVNFGGFFLGMLFGVIGGALAVAWTPVQPSPPATEPADTEPAEPTEEPGGDPAEPEAEAAPDELGPRERPDATVDEQFTGPLTDVLPSPVNPLTQPVSDAYRYEAGAAQYEEGATRYEDGAARSPDAYPYEDGDALPRDVGDTQHIPAHRRDEDQYREEDQPPQDPGNGTGPLPRRTPRLFVITLVPLLLTAVAFANLRGVSPARAAPAQPYPSPCPTATKSPSAKSNPSSSTASRAGGESGGNGGESAGETRTPSAQASAAPSPSASPSPSPESTADESNEDRGIIGGLLDGIGDLLGIGDDDAPSAAATPTATPTETPAATPSASTGSGGQKTEPRTSPSAARASASKPAKSASAKPKSASSADCVEVEVKELAADGVPVVQKVPDRMLGSKLTLSGFGFDGVTELTTADGGTIRVLQFSMDRAVTEDFELRVPGPGERTTSLTSSALTVEKGAGDAGQKVKFYCSRFSGKLTIDIFGVEFEIPLPLTFTPDFPPPLTFNNMIFTDVDIQLVFVDSDVLKAPNLVTKIVS